MFHRRSRGSARTQHLYLFVSFATFCSNPLPTFCKFGICPGVECFTAAVEVQLEPNTSISSFPLLPSVQILFRPSVNSGFVPAWNVSPAAVEVQLEPTTSISSFPLLPSVQILFRSSVNSGFVPAWNVSPAAVEVQLEPTTSISSFPLLPSVQILFRSSVNSGFVPAWNVSPAAVEVQLEPTTSISSFPLLPSVQILFRISPAAFCSNPLPTFCFFVRPSWPSVQTFVREAHCIPRRNRVAISGTPNSDARCPREL